MDKADQRIVIIGAGPTGLGAAYRLTQLGYRNFQVYERASVPGGLATSWHDDKGFTWDLGPHLLFSHYRYVDELIARAVPSWMDLKRESWIWIGDRMVPYPIQNNIRHLSRGDCWKALQGLIAVHNRSFTPSNFRDWIHATFGAGLAELFMLPYNEKIWACPTEVMDFRWIGERVSVVDLESVCRRIIHGEDDTEWGPNQRFRFPADGGIGALWNGVASLVEPGHISYHCDLVRIDPESKTAYFAGGAAESYDILISTLPVTVLIETSCIAELAKCKEQFKYRSTHVVGLGIAGKIPEHLKHASWIYFPERDYPFYRATIFSNYAPHSVPGADYWSVLVEFSESPDRPLDASTLIDAAKEGLQRARMLSPGAAIASTSHRREPYGYPVPFLGRDAALDHIHRVLDTFDIYSRGRFGGWKYEVSNQDQSLMQGVELVNRLMLGIPETTYWFPGTVNDKRYSIL